MGTIPAYTVSAVSRITDSCPGGQMSVHSKRMPGSFPRGKLIENRAWTGVRKHWFQVVFAECIPSINSSEDKFSWQMLCGKARVVGSNASEHCRLPDFPFHRLILFMTWNLLLRLFTRLICYRICYSNSEVTITADVVLVRLIVIENMESKSMAMKCWPARASFARKRSHLHHLIPTINQDRISQFYDLPHHSRDWPEIETWSILLKTGPYTQVHTARTPSLTFRAARWT